MSVYLGSIKLRDELKMGKELRLGQKKELDWVALCLNSPAEQSAFERLYRDVKVEPHPE